jgi:hypothetical protein
VLLTDIGKEQMDEIRGVSEQLLAERARKDAAGRKDVLRHAAAEPHRRRRR